MPAPNSWFQGQKLGTGMQINSMNQGSGTGNKNQEMPCKGLNRQTEKQSGTSKQEHALNFTEDFESLFGKFFFFSKMHIKMHIISVSSIFSLNV